MHCPYCGTPNWEIDPNVPETIHDLRNYCKKRRIHLHRNHFHLMEDYKEPKAYGLYRDEGGQYIVYKNHASGEREISYSGDSEREAVQHLYGSLCRALRGTEGRGSHKSSQKGFERVKKSERRRVALKFITLIVLVAAAAALLLAMHLATSSSEAPLEENEAVVAIDMAWRAAENPAPDAEIFSLERKRAEVV